MQLIVVTVLLQGRIHQIEYAMEAVKQVQCVHLIFVLKAFKRMRVLQKCFIQHHLANSVLQKYTKLSFAIKQPH